jgi:hypothetical protein
MSAGELESEWAGESLVSYMVPDSGFQGSGSQSQSEVWPSLKEGGYHANASSVPPDIETGRYCSCPNQQLATL